MWGITEDSIISNDHEDKFKIQLKNENGFKDASEIAFPSGDQNSDNDSRSLTK